MSDLKVSVVIPTYNERDNISALIEKLSLLFQSRGLQGEIIIVDDNSPDGTADEAEAHARRFPVRVLRRGQKSGLSSAVLSGFGIAGGEILGVMDADLSHDPEAVGALVEAVTSGRAEVSVGSRYVEGGGIRDWPALRRFMSWFAILLARPLTSVRDVTSGFFFLRKEVIEGVRLSDRGFKIGLEVMAKGRYGKIVEIPYTFTDRRKGSSKLKAGEVVDYLSQLMSLYGDRIIRVLQRKSRAR
ncbi:MAG: polyprenol monophosphomannose synthase [Armatimonadetes bacterium]|nr:polyprenol monophosphomannose synthase [Armatimonadota bacterium]